MSTDFIKPECNPLENLSPLVRELLLRSGWLPGNSRKKTLSLKVFDALYQTRYCLNSIIGIKKNADPDGVVQLGIVTNRQEKPAIARAILEELEWLKLPPLKRDGPWMPSRIEFCDALVSITRDRLDRLKALLKIEIYPIGLTPDAELLISDNEKVFIVGNDCPGVFLVGNSLSEGIERTLTGKNIRPIFFSIQQDPLGDFRLEGLRSDSSNVIIPHPVNGLNGIDTLILDETSTYLSDRVKT